MPLNKKVGHAPTFLFVDRKNRPDKVLYRQNQTLLQLLEPVVEAMGFELLGIEQGQQGGTEVVRVYIDQEAGIRVEDCERVSGQVSALMDVEDPVKGQYTLEVSSPGLDRPIFSLAQFARHAGAEAKVKLRQHLSGRRRLRGVIEEVGNNEIVMQVEGERFEVDADLIEHAHLIPQYD